MAKRVARKIKRTGKSASQFKFTSTFEYIDMECIGTWRPDNLRVLWLRSHRRTQSIEVEWVCTEDRGPNGASGRAVFDPPIAAALIVTLYRDAKKGEFEEKEYKYYIENDGPGGKKILASFTCDMSDYAGIPTSRHALEMNFKPVSRKISKCLLGITLESEFLKEGNANDDDMQSTFSAVEPGGDNMIFADELEDEEDDDDLDEAATLGKRVFDNQTNTDETTDETKDGQGELKRRSDINTLHPPRKPPRTGSLANLTDDDDLMTTGITIESTANEQLGSEEELLHSQQIDNNTNENEERSHDDVIMSPAKLVDEASNTIDKSHDELNDTIVKSHDETDDTDDTIVKSHDETNNTIDKSHDEVNDMMVKSHDETEDTINKSHDEVNDTMVKSHDETKDTIDMSNDEANDTIDKSHDETKDTIDKSHDEVNDTIDKSHGEFNDMIVDDPNNKSHDTLDKSHDIPSHVGPPVNNKSDIDQSLPDNSSVSETNIISIETQSDENSQTHNLQTQAHSYNEQTKEEKMNHIPTVMASFSVDPPTNQLDTPPESTDVIHEPPKETTPTNNEEPTTSNNPFDNESKGAESFGKLLWLPEAEFVDYNDMSIGTQRVESSQLIALYFSAQWCPPCRRFLPKLTKFYSTLKENNKPFEIVYVSNDNSRDEMVQYMSEQQMPWVALSYGHKLVEKLRLDYKVRSIPLLVVVSRSGQLLDDNAKKTVEGAGSAAAAVKLFSKWLEKSGEKSFDVFEDEEEVKQKKTILGSIKKALSRETVDKDEELSTEKKSPKTRAKSVDEQRETAQSKVPKSNITSGNKEELLRQLQDKEDVVRQLEEVNMSLKHTNDDLNEEVRTLRASLQQANEELQSLRESDAQKKEADEKFNEYLKLQGWLFKRGIKGPTANKWRRRYFRLDQGSKLYYYKSQAEGTPQGFIDLLKVISVSEVSPAQQDKNNASFNIQCEGRTFQLQAYDEAEMRRWITAIDKLKDFYRKQEAETEKST